MEGMKQIRVYSLSMYIERDVTTKYIYRERDVTTKSPV
jgi:hypothetical protein